VGLEQGHEHGQRAGAPLLQRQAEGAEIVQLEKRRLREDFIVAFLYIKEGTR